MKRADKRRSLSNNQTEHSARSGSKEDMQQQTKASRALKSKETISKPSYEKGEPGILVSDSSLGAEPSEVYMELVVHDINDSDRSAEASQNPTPCDMAEKERKYEQPKISADREKQPNHGEEESVSKTVTDSLFSNGELQTVEDQKVDRVTRRTKSELKSREADERTPEATMDVDALDDGLNNVGSDEETLNTEEETEHEEKEDLDPRIGEMEMRIEKLEEELREVAALEISLYSVVPDHGGSSHKVHTPARRLSRLYTHAFKHFSPCKRATIAKNTVSGLVLIAKSCGNDVPRLTFWWSNIVVLREIVTQAFGNSYHSASLTKVLESNVGAKNVEGKSPSLKWKTSFDSRQPNMHGFMDFIDEWQETETFTSALEKVESWIFSRIVESIWWQTLTPNMQSLAADTNINKSIGRLLGPALGDQQQGIFSISIWKIAFHDAFKRLCPVRAGGHDCGCLSVLSRMVMEKCVARLDVAMFNAILRESAYEIPTDPVSDPIVDSKVLPIPAGDLSFGSGAQLKNAVGNWSRYLSDWFGMDADDAVKEEHHAGENDDQRKAESKCFHLLNALSDLLMLPKDMLMDRSVRAEVCPSISLPLLKRILCNFTPDEFCPDAVPGTVLEAINAECIIERRLSGDNSSSFPYTASPVIYEPPSSTDVAEKVSDAGTNGELARSGSMIQRKGYTSDEELDALDSPLTSIIEKVHSSPSVAVNGNGEQNSHNGFNMRYGFLREVWLS